MILVTVGVHGSRGCSLMEFTSEQQIDEYLCSEFDQDESEAPAESLELANEAALQGKEDAVEDV